MRLHWGSKSIATALATTAPLTIEPPEQEAPGQ